MFEAWEAEVDRRVSALARWPHDRAGPVLARGEASIEPIERRLDRVVTALERRPPFNSVWLRDRLVGWLLPLWFVLLSAAPFVGSITDPSSLFLDARLYVDSTRAWLQGMNPWDVSYHGVYYAAPPPSLLPLVPFALLPTPLDWQVLATLCVLATVWTVRMLRLPWWWLLFPPLVQGLLGGNVQMLLIPLILRGGGWLAGLLKIYALVPLAFLGKWRQVGLALLLIVATVPILPWDLYLTNLSLINDHLDAQTGYGLSVSQCLLVLAPALLAMTVIGRQRAAWLAVPALWPSQQWYYASLALPVKSALVGALIAVPTPGSGALALFGLAIYELVWRRHRARRAALNAGDIAAMAAEPQPSPL